MLAQFALLAFGIFGIMALAIDLGIVTLTRVQMQNAADAAAIEGLRLGPAGRGSVAETVSWMFDDDFDVAAGESIDRQLGAGPVSLFDPDEPGITNLDGARLMQLPANPEERVYKPRLETNDANELRGDIVFGAFSYRDGPPPDERGRHQCVLSGDDDPDCPYVREDFTPVAGAQTALLVRLRRSRYVDDVEPGVSSNGGPVDLLFGRGTHVSDDPDALIPYNVRRDGLTVRATAIAGTAPVWRVGPAVVQPSAPPLTQVVDLPGAAPFAITADVSALPIDVPVTAPVDAGGTIAGLGHFAGGTRMMTVGDALPAPGIQTCDDPLAPTRTPPETIWFAPVFVAARLVRFVPVEFTWDCTAGSVTITRRSQRMATANATGIRPDDMPADVMTPPVLDSLAAPVLVR